MIYIANKQSEAGETREENFFASQNNAEGLELFMCMFLS